MDNNYTIAFTIILTRLQNIVTALKKERIVIVNIFRISKRGCLEIYLTIRDSISN